jgi:hypothetical protein
MSEIEKQDLLDISRTASTGDNDDQEQSWDDSSIDTEEGLDVVHAIRVVTERGQKASDLRCYKETVTYKKWFDAHVLEHPSTVCATSQVAKLCGVNLRIYYRPANDQRLSQIGRHRFQPRHRNHHHHSLTDLPINKVATMLTFHPNTGFYEHLIRGKAYIVVDDGNTKTSKHTLWMLQELISECKGRYHQYGADFSREGQMELLKACVQFKKGKWVPRSVYGIALAQTPDQEVAEWRKQRSFCSLEDDEEAGNDEVEEGPMRRSSASKWFISAYSIKDLQDPATVVLY